MSSKFKSRIKEPDMKKLLAATRHQIHHCVVTDKQRAKINPVNKAVASKIPSNKRK